MGGSQSVEIPGGGTEGYHVLRVCVHSLIHQSPPFYEPSFFAGPRQLTRVPSRSWGIFRLHPSHWKNPTGWKIFTYKMHRPLILRLFQDQDNDTLKELLRKSVNQEVDMLVYSSKSQTVRTLKIRPCSDWGGQGLLGVSIRFCSFQGASENVWHVLVRNFSFFQSSFLLDNCIVHRMLSLLPQPKKQAWEVSPITLLGLIRYCTSRRTCTHYLRRTKDGL